MGSQNKCSTHNNLFQQKVTIYILNTIFFHWAEMFYAISVTAHTTSSHLGVFIELCIPNIDLAHDIAHTME